MHIPDEWPNALTLACERCRHDTTWKRVDFCDNRDGRGDKGRGEKTPHTFFKDSEKTVEHYVLRYTCVSCERKDTAFWCAFARDGGTCCVRKQGQSPAWSIEPATAIAKALPPDVIEFYRKGLICTSHNFGLGAVGYFRRVVEQVTGHLLDLVEENAKVQGEQATLSAIAEARTAFSATDRLKHAATLLPATLRPGGANPLAKLYDSYSEGIHSLADEECLEVARDVQAGIDYLIPMLHEQLTAARAYQAAMTKAKRRK